MIDYCSLTAQHTEVEGEAGVGGALSGLTVSRRAERGDLHSVRSRLR